MDHQNLIITLIQQDLKHNQLVVGLMNMGLDSSGLHYLEIINMVSDLMNVPEGEIENDWGEIYVKYMNESVTYDVTVSTSSLRTLAETCYQELKEVLHH